MNLKLSLCLFAVLSVSIGCGERGPANHKLSGTITYKGNPVANGEVFLRPVGDGPGGFGFIKDGKFETLEGKGSQGGASMITFHGFNQITIVDGKEAGSEGDLFPPYTVEVDLPKEDFVYDVDVPTKPKR